LTAEEETQYTALLDEVSSMIAESVGRDDAWADELDPVPAAIRSVAVTAVVRAAQNPDGLLSDQEQLGDYSRTKRFPDPGEDAGTNLLLSDTEQRLIRRIVAHGAAWQPVRTILDDIPEVTLPDQYLYINPDGTESDC